LEELVAESPRWAVQPVAIERPKAPKRRTRLITPQRLRNLAIVLAIAALLLAALIVREGVLSG